MCARSCASVTACRPSRSRTSIRNRSFSRTPWSFCKRRPALYCRTGPAHGSSQELDWDLLVDREDGHGSERLKSQYIRANYQGSELYVLSVKGSTRYRLKPDQSHFDNLYLAGDWTWNDINVGCVEAAVISARYAAKAICGRTKVFPNTGIRVHDQIARHRRSAV